MGMRVEVDLPPIGAELDLAAQRGLLEGGQAVLAVAAANAPYEETPKHGVHLRETGYARLEPGEDELAVEVGFTAFWALWQEEDTEYHHEHGHPKFLELALVSEGETALQLAAEAMREVIE